MRGEARRAAFRRAGGNKLAAGGKGTFRQKCRAVKGRRPVRFRQGRRGDSGTSEARNPVFGRAWSYLLRCSAGDCRNSCHAPPHRPMFSCDNRAHRRQLHPGEAGAVRENRRHAGVPDGVEFPGGDSFRANIRGNARRYSGGGDFQWSDYPAAHGQGAAFRYRGGSPGGGDSGSGGNCRGGYRGV